MRKIWNGLAVSFIGAGAGLMLYCGSFYLKSCQENRQMRNKYEYIRESCLDTEEDEIKEMKADEKEIAEPKVIEKSFGISWKELRSVNPEIRGWITVPGANISYPIVQGKDDEFYLTHSVEGTKSPFGSIFLGCGHNGDFSDTHSLVYGHNMEGHMMFANLNCYERREFFEECPEFIITTPERQLVYEIFSVEQAQEGGTAFGYGYEIGSEEYEEQLKDLRRNSMYETGILPNGQQKMVTLVTCNSNLEENVRMAVHGICKKILTETER